MNQMQLIDMEAKPDNRRNLYPPEFERFWNAYPRKVGKGAALRAWKNQRRFRPETDEVIAAIEQHRQSTQWQEPQFIPHPATWLNRHGWDDEPEILPQNSPPVSQVKEQRQREPWMIEQEIRTLRAEIKAIRADRKYLSGNVNGRGDEMMGREGTQLIKKLNARIETLRRELIQ